jgi:dTDP-4-amino-4,6-dideoxygalactose transaminase
VELFEEKLREYIDHPYILTLNSATSGLTLALRLLKRADPEVNWPGLEDTDIVLTTALTCTATNWPILANNMEFRWVDVDPNTCNMNMDDLRNKLSERTKVIMVVHWGGYPLDLDKLKDIQEYSYQRYGFRPMIIEDCAHAFGATYKSKKLSGYGNICVFSLQAIKHLTTGDGGFISLPNATLYNRGKLLRWYGIDRDKRNYKRTDFRLESDVTEWGYKFHMNDINATLGIYNLPHMDNNLAIARSNASYYHTHLQGLKNIMLMENASDRESACWLYTIKVQNKVKFIEYMNSKAIMTSQVHNRNDVHTCVEKYRCELPILDELEKLIVCIPVGWWVTPENRSYIVESIKEYDNL